MPLREVYMYQGLCEMVISPIYSRMTFKLNPTREQEDPRLLKEVGDLSLCQR